MRELKKILKKRWVWGIGVFVLFTLLFTSFFALKESGIIFAAPGDTDEVEGYQFVTPTGIVENGGSVLLRNRTGRIQLIGGMVNDVNVRFSWVSNDTGIIDITSADTNMPMVDITAGNRAGLATITVTVEKMDDAGTTVVQRQTALLQIEVRFLISEDFPSQTAPDTSTFMTRLNDGDEKKSLIMNQDSVVSVGKAEDASGTSLIKPVFGDLTRASWSSSNEDVVRYDEANKRIQAMGAGSARLTASYTVGTDTYTEYLDVYVKPQLTVPDADDPSKTVIVGGVNAQGGVNNPSGTVTVENGDKIGVSVLNVARPELAVGDKIVWVISKGEGENAELVRDSLGNTGESSDDANLVYIRSEKAYRLDAKAGVYNIQFYVKGTYINFEDSKEPLSISSRIGGMNLITSVKCIYEDTTITLNIGSSYSLADALNMPLSMLKNNFSSRPTAPQNGWEDIIGWDSDNLTITAKSLGTQDVKITVRPNNDLEIADIPGMRSKDPITVTVKIVDTFSLNISAAQLAVGATLDLYGMIGSETYAEDSQFHWTIDNERYLSFEPKLEEGREGPIATVRANAKPSDRENPVTVRLAWTDDKSVTWVATCKITIVDSPTDFRITKETLSMEVGDTDTLETNLSGSQDILWISSDPSIVTVEPNTGNTTAKVTATDQTGSVVITALNKANNAYATCIVTVHALITSVKIDKSPSYTTTIGTPFVFMEVTYQPANATATEMIWKSTNEAVATVDDKGMVTVKSVGQTIITVRPVRADLSNGDVYDECVLTVKDDPITAIRTDVTSLNMVRGDTYQVVTTLTPANPTDRTLTWSTNKASVATVNNGLITATGVGTATIMVQGGNATPVLIEVNVRERVGSIAFEETNVSIAVKETKKLNVIFTPDTGVNKNVTFYSSDTSVVTVAADGTITGMAMGQAMITCISEDLGEYRPITCNITVTQEVIVPTAFTVDPLEKTIQAGETFQITPIFTPENTSNKEVRYQTLDESIATVDETGVVTGVMKGQTIIQIIAVQSNLTAICNVTVEDAVEFSLSPSSREIALGRTFRITKVTNPSNVDKSAVWQTSNSRIASINARGVVTGKKIGSCTITCTLKKYKQSATCRVKVARLRSTLKLDKTSIRMNVGSTYRLKKTVWSNNTSTPGVKFTSQNSKIASVGSTTGKIRAKKVGSTVITAKTKDDVRATARCRVTVIHRSTGISLNKTYAVCHIGRTIKLNATVKPKNSSIKKVKWTSSDNNIASVTGSGKITGYAEGDVYITATTTDGSNKSARCFIRVTESVPATSIMVAQPKLTMKKGNTAQLSYTILPDNNTDSVKMASDNKHVATVTNTGKVRAVGTGTANVTITTSSGIVSEVEINVVALNKTSVEMRQYDTETLMVMGTNDNITWYSANNRIATVTGGRVVGRGIGTTYVYAFVNGCKMGCKVKVVSVNSK